MSRCTWWCDRRHDGPHNGMCASHVTSVIGHGGSALGFTVETMSQTSPRYPVLTAGSGDDVVRVILDWSDVAVLIEQMIKAQMRHSPGDVLPKRKATAKT